MHTKISVETEMLMWNIPGEFFIQTYIIIYDNDDLKFEYIRFNQICYWDQHKNTFYSSHIC